MNKTLDKKTPNGKCAVRLATNDDETRALAAYIGERPACGVVEFAPKDDDDLDVELTSGRFDRVIFASLDALLTTIWKGHAHIDRWVAAGVRIELATPQKDDGADRQVFIMGMYDSLARWRREQRKRQIVAAVILSGLALIAMAALLFLVPGAE